MPWMPVAASVVGGLLGGSQSGGGQQTVNKDPWAPAQDWMKANIASGQNLQNQYAANPFSAYQQNAYGNSQALSQGARSILAQILPQMSGATGFDRNNPLAKPQGFTFSTPANIAGTPINSSLGFGALNSSVDPAKSVQPVAAPAQAPQLSFADQMAQYQREQAMANRTGGNGGR